MSKKVTNLQQSFDKKFKNLKFKALDTGVLSNAGVGCGVLGRPPAAGGGTVGPPLGATQQKTQHPPRPH